MIHAPNPTHIKVQAMHSSKERMENISQINLLRSTVFGWIEPAKGSENIVFHADVHLHFTNLDPTHPEKRERLLIDSRLFSVLLVLTRRGLATIRNELDDVTTVSFPGSKIYFWNMEQLQHKNHQVSLRFLIHDFGTNMDPGSPPNQCLVPEQEGHTTIPRRSTFSITSITVLRMPHAHFHATTVSIPVSMLATSNRQGTLLINVKCWDPWPSSSLEILCSSHMISWIAGSFSSMLYTWVGLRFLSSTLPVKTAILILRVFATQASALT